MKTSSPPTPDPIAELAYQLWEQAGRPEGRSEEFWRQAEDRRRASAGPAPAAPASPPPAATAGPRHKKRETPKA